jgi:cytochrome P450
VTTAEVPTTAPPAAPATLPPGPSQTVLRQSLAWGFRPRPFLDAAHRQFGDMFTIRLGQVGPIVMLAHPDMIKDVFTGDPAVFHAGEANLILRPSLGRHSVLLLDDAQHMSQRKLLLPPFHGERMTRYGELMREIAERDIATWPRGVPFRLHPHTQDVTLTIIVRAVFGVTEPARSERMRNALKEFIEWGTSPRQIAYLSLMDVDGIERSYFFRRARAKVDRVVYDEIRHARDRQDLDEREDILSLLLQARHEDGSPMSDEELRAVVDDRNGLRLGKGDLVLLGEARGLVSPVEALVLQRELGPPAERTRPAIFLKDEVVKRDHGRLTCRRACG